MHLQDWMNSDINSPIYLMKACREFLPNKPTAGYYKHNLGDEKFEQAKLVTPKPSFLGLGGQLHLADLDADGRKQLVHYVKNRRDILS
jgi:hypothetical protein